MFEKMTSDIVTFNAAMYQGDKRYKMAEQLAQKNIDNRVASDHDYVGSWSKHVWLRRIPRRATKLV